MALAYRRYRAAAEAVVLYATRILPQSEKNLETIRAAYGLGEFSIFDVLQQQGRLIESETGYNEALRDYYTSLAELERALGTTIPATGFAPGQASVLPDEMPRREAEALRRNWRQVLSSKQGFPSPVREAPIAARPQAESKVKSEARSNIKRGRKQ